MTVTIERREVVPCEGLSNLSPLLQRIYSARDIQTVDDLDKALVGLLPFSDLLHIDEAARQLSAAVRDNQRILIVGDFSGASRKKSHY